MYRVNICFHHHIGVLDKIEKLIRLSLPNFLRFYFKSRKKTPNRHSKKTPLKRRFRTLLKKTIENAIHDAIGDAIKEALNDAVKNTDENT